MHAGGTQGMPSDVRRALLHDNDPSVPEPRHRLTRIFNERTT